MSEHQKSLRELLNSLNRSEKLEFAARCGTTVSYLRKLGYGQCSPSLRMLLKIRKCYPFLDPELIAPESDRLARKRGSRGEQAPAE